MDAGCVVALPVGAVVQSPQPVQAQIMRGNLVEIQLTAQMELKS